MQKAASTRNAPLVPDAVFKDMVALTLHFSDKTAETIYCPWTEVDGYDDFNASQEARFSPRKDM